MSIMSFKNIKYYISLLLLFVVFSNLKISEAADCGSVDDIDGNTYNTVMVGSRCWLAQPLRVTKNPSGVAITRFCTNDNPANCNTYGGLYTWDTAMDGSSIDGVQGICPTADWIIPSDSDFYELENYIKNDGQTCDANRISLYDCASAGTKLKGEPSSIGFYDKLAGYRLISGAYNYVNQMSHYWSSSESSGKIWSRYLSNIVATEKIQRHLSEDKNWGFSVRCVVPSPSCTLTATPNSTLVGGSVDLNWTFENTVNASIDHGIGNVTALTPPHTFDSVSPPTTFVMTVVNSAGGTATCSENISIGSGCSLYGNPSTMAVGSSTILDWNVNFATSGTITPGADGVIGSIAALPITSGFASIFPTTTAIYTLTLDDGETCSETINVVPPLPPPAGGHMKLNYFDKDIVEVFNDAAKVLLSYAGRIALLFLIFGGIYYIISGSDPQKQEIAKKTITYALLGLIVVLSSYAVIAVLDRILVS